MASSSLLRPSSHNPTIYITGLQSNVTIQDLADKFGTIGRIKTDKRSGEPKIYVYNDKSTNAPKGDGTVTFEDPNAASAAVDWFNGTEFMGSQITVQLAEEKEYVPQSRSGGRPRQDYGSSGEPRSYNSHDRYGAEADEYAGYDAHGRDGRQSRPSSSGYRGGPQANVSGEWNCPSCSNMNFAKRMECFKCHTPRPSASDDPQQSLKQQAIPNFANPGDWTCKACSNINWARRNTCNRCNAPKPTAVIEKRTGRGGGYNEREEPYERHEPANRPNRDYYRTPERSYRQEPSYDHIPRRDNYPDSEYGYGSRDRPFPYASHTDSYNRNSSYRQDSGYRRERSRSPYRY